MLRQIMTRWQRWWPAFCHHNGLDRLIQFNRALAVQVKLATHTMTMALITQKVALKSNLGVTMFLSFVKKEEDHDNSKLTGGSPSPQSCPTQQAVLFSLKSNGGMHACIHLNYGDFSPKVHIYIHFPNTYGNDATINFMCKILVHKLKWVLEGRLKHTTIQIIIYLCFLKYTRFLTLNVKIFEVKLCVNQVNYKKKVELWVHWLVIFLVHVKIMRRWGYCLETQTHYFVITIWEKFYTNIIRPKAFLQCNATVKCPNDRHKLTHQGLLEMLTLLKIAKGNVFTFSIYLQCLYSSLQIIGLFHACGLFCKNYIQCI